MSNKINVMEILTSHYRTLCNGDEKISSLDITTFFLIPFALALASAISGFNLDKDQISVLVNFGAIFTALLLSVLVLVYDQKAKLESSPETKLTPLKKTLLKQLYYNISYSITISIILVVACFLQSITMDSVSTFTIANYTLLIPWGVNFTTPLCIFLTANLILTILMVVKRMNVLLTSL